MATKQKPKKKPAKKRVPQKGSYRSSRNEHKPKPNYDTYVEHVVRRFEDCASNSVIRHELVRDHGCPPADADSILSTVSELYLAHDPDAMQELFAQVRLANSKMLQMVSTRTNQPDPEYKWVKLRAQIVENMRRLLPDRQVLTVDEGSIDDAFFQVHGVSGSGEDPDDQDDGDK